MASRKIRATIQLLYLVLVLSGGTDGRVGPYNPMTRTHTYYTPLVIRPIPTGRPRAPDHTTTPNPNPPFQPRDRILSGPIPEHKPLTPKQFNRWGLPLTTLYVGSNGWSYESKGGFLGNNLNLASSQSQTCNILQSNQSLIAKGPEVPVLVTLYELPNFEGTKKELALVRNRCYNVNLMDGEWNDRTSSIKVGTNSCVVIWENEACERNFACIWDGSPGAAALRDINMDNDLTSIQVC